MSRHLHRQVELTMAKPLTEAQLSSPDTPPNAIVIRDLRVTFQIEKNLGKEPNTGSVSVFGLDAESRAMAQKAPLYVRLDAGYDGKVERLFVGELRHGYSVKHPAQWETRLELADGERSFRFGRVNRSFLAGASALDAVNEAAKGMGLEPKMSPATRLILRRQYAGGLSLHGPAHVELTRALTPFGLTWSIQDGELQILSSEETRLDQALVVSEATGLLGSPEFGLPENPKKPPTLHARMQLEPRLRPGGRIMMDSLAVKGPFKLKRVVHAGDSFRSGPWHSEIEARQ